MQAHCPNCGAPNAADATRCVNCGAALPRHADGADAEPTIIDVTAGDPQVVPAHVEEPDEHAWPYTFSTRTFEHGPGRVIVARGGTRGCLLVGVVLLLAFCCSCWALSQLFGNPGGFFDINWF
jgi:hypothetical protein